MLNRLPPPVPAAPGVCGEAEAGALKLKPPEGLDCGGGVPLAGAGEPKTNGAGEDVEDALAKPPVLLLLALLLGTDGMPKEKPGLAVGGADAPPEAAPPGAAGDDPNEKAGLAGEDAAMDCAGA